MMKMSFLFLHVSLISILIVSGLQQNYHDILTDVNNLPNLVKFLQKYPDYVSDAAEKIEKSTGLNSILSLTRQHADEGNITTTVSPGPVMSELCVNQSTALAMAVFERQKWAEKMIDATGKLPADVLDGDVIWLGDYEECLSVHSNLTSYPGKLQEFDGEYCLVGIPVPGPVNPMTLQSPMIQIGLCVPDSCTEADTIIMLNSVLSRATNNTLLAKTSICQEQDRKFDTRAVIVMVIVSLFMTVMVVATLYDIIWIHWPKWQTEKVSAMLNGEIADNYERISSDEVKPLLGDKVTDEYRPSIGEKILLSFSIYTNGAKILSTSQPAGSLSAVNGIRFISMTWVILGHTYAFLLASGDNIVPFLAETIKRWTFQAILNALVSVDTFFTLSGLLVTYLTMRELKRRDGKLNWLLFYFHRFWRLTPPYMLILMVYVSLFPYVGSGPMWKKQGMEYNYCKDSWFYNILYINNFVSITDPSKQCMAWSWYLANDMQFFVVTPLIIIPLFFSKIAGLTVMFVFLLGTWITTGVISTHYQLSPTLLLGNTNFQAYFEYYYERPYCRIGPYLVGMFTGYLLFKMNCRCRINRYVNLLLWAVATGLALIILYGLYDEVNGHPMSVEVAALYNTVHRTLWGACVCWVIFACATGNGGFVNTFLSWKAFIPLGRLTYCAYLIHPIIIYYYTATQRRLVHFTDLNVIYMYLGNLGLSYAAAFIASLAFESPMMGLEKVIFKRGEKKD